MPTRKAAVTATAKPFPTGNLTPHKLSQLVPGEMSAEEYIALRESVKEDGIQNEIVVYEGQILDGRHRYQVCKELKLMPKCREFKGTAKQAAALVLDNNLHRRTLNSMQKAIVAARMHLNKDIPMTQKDTAARVGVGVATVNLAVRLLNSENTLLIKRCESGDATRAEIDELLFDRQISQEQERVAAIPASGATEEDLEDVLGTPGNVVSINKNPTIAGKRDNKPRAAESAASRCVQHFKGLSAKERVDFVVLGWAWLEPAMRAAEKLPKATAQAKPITQTVRQLAKASTTPADRAVAKAGKLVQRKAAAKAAKVQARKAA